MKYFFMFLIALIVVIAIAGGKRGRRKRRKTGGISSLESHLDAETKGFIGELLVKLFIGKTSEKPGREKYVINNFLIELEEGKTSQTDHVLINENGVFVIETKNYSGRIYGDDNSREWTQVFNYGRTKNHFYSPLKQNAAHAYHISTLLGEDAPVYSAVVFVKGNITYIKSTRVYTLFGLLRFIRTPRQRILTSSEMRRYYETLTEKNRSGEISNEEHVENIERMQTDIQNRICPRCHGTLVERKGARGVFLGCSNYPKCKFTMKLPSPTPSPKPQTPSGLSQGKTSPSSSAATYDGGAQASAAPYGATTTQPTYAGVTSVDESTQPTPTEAQTTPTPTEDYAPPAIESTTESTPTSDGGKESLKKG